MSESPNAELLLCTKVLNDRGFNCCGKPQGCTNMNPGCAYLQHPFKKWVREVSER